MADRARRARGLRSSFPAAYDTRPRTSALGALLDALADRFTDLDEVIEQVIHNRWVRLAREHAPADDPNALQTRRACITQLARLVGAVPLPQEPLERFRQRVIAQAQILRAGVTTPRSILALATTALGLELCHKLDKLPPQGGARITVGHALRPGTLAACGRQCGRITECPHQAAREAQLLLIDNPPDLRTRRLPGVKPGDVLELASESIEDAEPVLRLSVPAGGAPVAWPSLQHAEETLFYAGILAPGETLVVTPVRAGDESSGSAVLIDAVQGQRRLAPELVVYFTNSARFEADPPVPKTRVCFAADDATADAAVTRFARFGETTLRTPLLPAGGARWTVSQLDRKQLADLLGPDEAAQRFPHAPELVLAAPFDLKIEWTAYPAATFQLRIPRNQAVRDAEAHGATALVQELVELARGAGIVAWVDFPQEQDLRDTAPEADDSGWHAGLAATLHEPHAAAARLELAAEFVLAERPSQDDALRVNNEVAYPLFAGIFAADDMAIGTRFNTSHIADEND